MTKPWKTRHYSTFTATGQILRIHPIALNLPSCPTIADSNLQVLLRMYPSKWRSLEENLRLSNGWERIFKSCCVSSLPIPDGVPFYFHTPNANKGNTYFLLPSLMNLP